MNSCGSLRVCATKALQSPFNARFCFEDHNIPTACRYNPVQAILCVQLAVNADRQTF